MDSGETIIQCPYCGGQLPIEESYFGRKAQCPYCERKFIIGETGVVESSDAIRSNDGATPAAQSTSSRKTRRWNRISFLVSIVVFVSCVVYGVWRIVKEPSYDVRDIISSVYAENGIISMVRRVDKGSDLLISTVEDTLKNKDACYSAGEDLLVFKSGVDYAFATVRGSVSDLSQVYKQPVIVFRKAFEVGQCVPADKCWMFDHAERMIDFDAYERYGENKPAIGCFFASFREPTPSEMVRIAKPHVRYVCTVLLAGIISGVLFAVLLILHWLMCVVIEFVNN